MNRNVLTCGNSKVIQCFESVQLSMFKVSNPPANLRVMAFTLFHTSNKVADFSCSGEFSAFLLPETSAK
jgi:hypothetical protein